MVGPTLVVEGPDHHYLARVLRLTAGDRVTLFDGGGAEVEAEVSAVGRRSLALRLGERRAAATGAGEPRLVLLQGLPKGDRFDLVVEKATEIGVACIVPVLAARSVVRPAARAQRWRRVAAAAARQSGRADVPAIDEPASFADALADLPAGSLRLLVWEGARDARLGEAIAKAPVVALAVGPEGGWTADEVAAASEAGLRPVGLGWRTLRSETAALAALAIVAHRLGALG